MKDDECVNAVNPQVRKVINESISEYLTEFTTDLRVGAVSGGALSAQFFAQTLVEIKAELVDLRLQLEAVTAAQNAMAQYVPENAEREAITEKSTAAVQALAQHMVSAIRQKRISDVGASKLVIPK